MMLPHVPDSLNTLQKLWRRYYMAQGNSTLQASISEEIVDTVGYMFTNPNVGWQYLPQDLDENGNPPV